MKAISIRELHQKTGQWVRGAGRHGEIRVTDRGRTVAKIVPETDRGDTPYFSRRKLAPAFRRRMGRGGLQGGTDSTQVISEERDRRIS
jgi:antitoxin (DNA-binding transcriptional repressor) of toxin-antitoxin stability system